LKNNLLENSIDVYTNIVNAIDFMGKDIAF